MTAAERLLFSRVQRRAAELQPDMARAILRAFAAIRDSFTEAQLTRIVELGFGDLLFDRILSEAVLQAAYQPVRDQMRRVVDRSFTYTVRGIPAPRGRTLSVAFDVLHPTVLDAIRTLETRVVTSQQEAARETIRQHVTAGLEAGLNPRAIGRELRDVIGLAPNQELAVRNFRAALEGTGRSPLDFALRDKRFDGTIRKGALTTKQVDTMTAAYRKRMIAFNAETQARTATLDALKLGQRLAWEQAAASGAVDRERLQKTWIGVMDDRERPEHRAMEGVTVGFDEPFPPPSGEMIPGESTYNCRCVARYTLGAP